MKRQLQLLALAIAVSFAGQEAVSAADNLYIDPGLMLASGPVGGPFTNSPAFFTLTNGGAGALNWQFANTANWLTVSTTNNGTIGSLAKALVTVTIGNAATSFPAGITNGVIWFTNLTSGLAQSRTVSLSVGQSMFENFEPGIHTSLWSDFGGGVVGSTVMATNYGGSVSGTKALWFGNAGTRSATTVPLDTSLGGGISFYLRLGNGGAAPWELVDLPAKGIVLEYSTTGGVNWTNLGTYASTNFYLWTRVTTNLPAGAMSVATQFRWRQLSNGGTCCDQWALDDISIDARPTPPTIPVPLADQSVRGGSNVTFTALAQGSQPLIYQWLKNGTNLTDEGRISGTTSATLSLATVVESDSGQYSVLVTNSFGAASSSATLLVTVVDHFQWGAIASPQAVGVPFSATITAKDYLNATATNYGGTVAMGAAVTGDGLATRTIVGNLVPTVAYGGGYTIGYAFNPNTNLTVTAVRAYTGTKVSIWTDAGELLASQSVSNNPGVWVETPLATPLQLNASTTYRVACYTANDYSYASSNGTNTFADGTMIGSYESYGDTFPNAVDATHWWLVDLRYVVGFGLTVPITPTVSGNFTNGVWTGSVAALSTGSNVVMTADGGSGHLGVSGAFDVLLPSDIALAMVDAPDPVSVGGNLTYTLTVTNAGPTAATSVTVSNFLPLNVTFGSATASQGSCTQFAGVVTCNLGTVPGAGSATITIVVTPSSDWLLSNSAVVTCAEADPNLVNNTAWVVTSVTPPIISIGDASVVEGNVGITNMVFAVTLSAASAQTITVNYETVDRGAWAGSDYVSTNGVLTFAPGITNQSITVGVIGDLTIETNETFSAIIYNPNHAVMGRSTGVGTIINDDGLPGLVDHFTWDPIGSPQLVGVPFNVTLTAKDVLEATVTNFSGSVALTNLAGSGVANTILGNLVPTVNSSGNYTLGYAFTPNTNIVVTHVRSYSGTKVSIWLTDGTLLASQNVTNAGGAWVETPLATPLALSAGSTYIVSFYTAGGIYYYRTDRTNSFPNGTLTAAYNFSAGDGFPSTVFSANQVVYLVDLRYTVNGGVPISVTPASLGPFTNGVWTGSVTAQQPGTNVTLTANDGNGHFGLSNPFDAGLQNDIAIGMVAAPAPVPVGATLTYALTVTNIGPATATGVMVTNQLPAGVTFLSATASQGSCTQFAGVVTCSLGSIADGTNATVSILVSPTIPSVSLTNTAVVTRAEADTYLGNNTATVSTTVTVPAISIGDASVVEGNVGITNMVFAVTLSAASAQTITVNYATGSGGASAGSDYVSTNGVLTFAPGITNQSITVGVVGDLLVETNETFFVNLSNPTNGVLGRSTGVGTIINDDGVPGMVDHFIWDPIASPQLVGVPFGATVTAKDILGTTVTNFSGTVGLTNAPGVTNTILGNLVPTTSSSGSYTLGYSFTPNANIVVTHVRSYSGTKVSIWQTNGTLLASQNVSGPGGSWKETPLATPLTLSAGSTYIVSFYTGGGSYYYRTDRTNSFPNGTLTAAYNSTTGDGFPSTVNSGNQTVFLVDLRYTVNVGVAISVTPTLAGPFTNGVWTGSLTMQQPGTNASLIANDGNGHTGLSYPFYVINSNQPPIVVASPANTNVYLGGAAAFQVDVYGAVPLFYQWRFNGVDIPGATNAVLTLNHLSLAQGGNYSVVAGNAFGTTNSAKASLSVLQVVAWGSGTNNSTINNNYGQSIIPAGLTNVVGLAGGIEHVVAVKADGSVAAWGAATNPPGTLSPNYGQSLVPPLGSVVAVAGGGYHTLALRDDGTMAAWGAGTNYTGSSPSFGQSIIPQSASNVVAIAAGDSHSMALRSDGRVLVWGFNNFSQTNVPTAATSNVVAIASRGNHLLALKTDGSLVHWGSQTVLPIGGSNIVAIAAGVNHSLALRSDGTVISWGGQTTVPAGLSNVVDIAAGNDQSLALRSDGTVVTWGATNLFSRDQIPPGLSNFVGIACGSYNSMGYLGDGSPVIKYPPVSRTALLSSNVVFYVLAVGQQLQYQWQFNGTDIPSATNFTYTIPGVQAANAGNFRVVITNAMGAVTSPVVSLTVTVPIGAAVDATNLIWITSGNAAWFGETTITHDGVDAAQSGVITHGQQVSVQANVAGPGVLTFWWKVSSEQFYDNLSFLIDSVQQTNVSGEVDWQAQTFAIGSGNHTLKWTYQKDASVSLGSDAGWLDQVLYTTNAPVITVQPISQTNVMGATFALSVTASGAPPMTYQWIKTGTNTSGGNASIFNITNATRHDSAVYSVVASNPGGSTASSNATVVIRVPQQLKVGMQPDGTFVLTSADADGGLLLPEDLGNIEALVSSNLFDWTPLTNGLVLTNGTLLLVDPDSTNYPTRYYRTIEH
ncbi:MAG: hypothetical protein JWR19_2831 [Pedosphaera sp.]|nr:hypothetical protein [Pedosphaera sp.]